LDLTATQIVPNCSKSALQ